MVTIKEKKRNEKKSKYLNIQKDKTICKMILKKIEKGGNVELFIVNSELF